MRDTIDDDLSLVPVKMNGIPLHIHDMTDPVAALALSLLIQLPASKSCHVHSTSTALTGYASIRCITFSNRSRSRVMHAIRSWRLFLSNANSFSRPMAE